jgi:hypothetical protein
MTALIGVTFAVPGATASASAPAYTLEERAQAIAQPSIMYLELISHGVVRDRKTGRALSGELKVSIRCSAVVISSNGYALSTGACISPAPDRLARVAFGQFANLQIAAKKLTAEGKPAYVDQLAATAAFTDMNSSATPARQVFAQSGDATGGLEAAPAVPVEAPDPPSDGEARLVVAKIASGGLPALLIAEPPALSNGDRVVAVGYQPVIAGRTYERAHVPITVAGSKGTTEPIPYKLGADIATEMRGGGLVNLDGQLAGSLLWSDTANDAQAIRDVLTQAGVKNELSDADRLYRSAIDDYFGGHYKQAIKKFDSVIQANPANSTAQQYRALAVSRQAIEGDDEPSGLSMPTWLIIAISALGSALLSVIVAVVVVRRRKPNRDFHTDPLQPISVNPFSPVSGPGGYPTSGGGFMQYPTGSLPTIDPNAAAAQPTVLEIPEAAPPGVPVPRPPVQRPVPVEHPASAALGQPSTEDSAGEVKQGLDQASEVGAPTAEPAKSQTADDSKPASEPVDPAPRKSAPEFVWPDDESEPAPAPGPGPDNPWAPPPR